MAIESSANSYEAARKQRLLDNKKRFEDLGLLKLSKSLSDLKKSEKKVQQKQHVRLKQNNDKILVEPRRSSRARNPVPSYRDDVDVELPSLRKRSRSDSSWASYLARPIEEVKTASHEDRKRAYTSAEKLQSNLQSQNPSFIKSMVRSHVYSCFWLGLPNRFCKHHLPQSTVDLVLEDEEGSAWEAIFISKRAGLSGGWRAFALEHKLDDGDALLFELVEPTRFKIYIVRAFDCQDQDAGDDEVVVDEVKDEEAEGSPHTAKKRGRMRGCNQPEKGKSETEKSSSQVSGIRRSLRKKN